MGARRKIVKEKAGSVKAEPKVVIAGEEVTGNKTYKDPGGVVWGLFLVFSGTLLLLNTLGIIPWEVWNSIVSFWPLLLILIGIRIILGEGAFPRLVMILLSLGVFGLMFLFALRESGVVINNLPLEVERLLDILDTYKK